MTPEKIPDWVKKRQEQQKIDAIENSKFYKFPEGETSITVDTSAPPKEVDKFGKKRWQYTITVDGKEKILEVGSTLDAKIITALMKNLNPMTVIRVGKDINTSYSIKGLDD